MTKARVALIIVAGCALVVFWATRPGRSPAPSTPPSPPAPAPQPEIRDAAAGPDKVRLVLWKGEPGEVGRLAAEWRRFAREKPEFLRRLLELLRADEADARERELAAFVLGTLPDREGLAALAEALREARDPKWIRALLLALGCDRTSGEDDDIFALPDAPRVLKIPIGLSVRVRGLIEDRELRDRMAPHVKSETPGVRWAAAVALSDSTEFADIRDPFLAALPGERDPAALGELSKALADWAAVQPEESSERLRIFTVLLEGADREDAAALRLRSEDGLKRMPLGSAEVRLMTGRVEAGSLDQKRWAIAVLSGAAGRTDLPDRDLVFETLSRAASGASEAKVRELAVTGLSAFADPAPLSRVLIAALGDPAWHVRAAAARGMGRAGTIPENLEALKKAETGDADERVRKIAAEVRRNLTGR